MLIRCLIPFVLVTWYCFILTSRGFVSDKKDPKAPQFAYLEKYREMVSQVQLASQSRLWIGKDYNNFVLKDLTNLDDPFEGDARMIPGALLASSF